MNVDFDKTINSFLRPLTLGYEGKYLHDVTALIINWPVSGLG
jgi:hypothetical protein